MTREFCAHTPVGVTMACHCGSAYRCTHYPEAAAAMRDQADASDRLQTREQMLHGLEAATPTPDPMALAREALSDLRDFRDRVFGSQPGAEPDVYRIGHDEIIGLQRKVDAALVALSAPVQGPVDQQANAKGLLPCPFCGARTVELHPLDLAINARSMDAGAEVHYAHCDGCGAEGPQDAQASEAIAAWNRRAATSAAPVQGVPEGLAALKRGNLAFTSRGPVHSISITWQSQEDRDSAYHGLIKSMVKGETSPEPPAPVAAWRPFPGTVVEQGAEYWARDEFGLLYRVQAEVLDAESVSLYVCAPDSAGPEIAKFVRWIMPVHEAPFPDPAAPSVDAEAWRAEGVRAGLEQAAQMLGERAGQKPCDCIRQEDGGWTAYCDCGNLGDAETAGQWCEATNAAASLRRQIASTPAPASTGEPVLPAPLRVGAAVFGRGVKLETVQGAIDRATGREETGLPEIKPHPEGALVFRETVEPELADLAQAGQFRCSTCGGSGHVDDAAASTGETIERAAQALCEHGADIPRAVLGVKWSALAERFPPVAELYRQMARVVLSAASTGEAESDETPEATELEIALAEAILKYVGGDLRDLDGEIDETALTEMLETHNAEFERCDEAREEAERQLAEALRERDEALAALEQIGASPALMAIAAERRRQVEEEGWTAEHDDQHDRGELARAAACYADPINEGRDNPPSKWPWGRQWWKPKDRFRDLERSGALTVAELDRLIRAKARALSQQGGEETSQGHAAVEAWCVHRCLDDAGVPRADDKGAVYSLWGRVEAYRSAAREGEGKSK